MNIKNRATAAKFVKVWNLAPDITTAAQRLGMSRRNATMRASQYRDRYKIPLQRFGTKQPEVDWDHVRLIAICATAKRERIKHVCRLCA